MRFFPVLLVSALFFLAACENNQAPAAPAAKPAQKQAATVAKADKPDGKAIFQAQCTDCHSATAGGVPPPADAEVTDLSGVSAKYEAAWLKRYLQGQETIAERKHPTTLEGNDAEQDALVSWLMSLKPGE